MFGVSMARRVPYCYLCASSLHDAADCPSVKAPEANLRTEGGVVFEETGDGLKAVGPVDEVVKVEAD